MRAAEPNGVPPLPPVAAVSEARPSAAKLDGRGKPGVAVPLFTPVLVPTPPAMPPGMAIVVGTNPPPATGGKAMAKAAAAAADAIGGARMANRDKAAASCGLGAVAEVRVPDKARGGVAPNGPA